MQNAFEIEPDADKKHQRLHSIEKIYKNWKSHFRLASSGVALTLGFVGYTRESLHVDAVTADIIIDNFYKSLQLLTTQMPRNYSVDMPWELQIARFAVPATAIWLSVGVFLDNVRKPLHLISVARAKNHVVVVGSSARAQEVARQCAAAGQKVICVVDKEEKALIAKLQSGGVLVIMGDPRDAGTYKRVLLHRARSIVIATGDNVLNLSISAASRNYTLSARAEDAPPLTLVVEIEGTEMKALLEASFHRNRERRIVYRLFDGGDNIARSLFPRLAALVARPGAPPAILMIGLDGLGEAILFKLIRNCLEGTRILIALPQADDGQAALKARYPFMDGLGTVEFIEAQPGPSLTASQALRQRLCDTRIAVVVVNAGGGDRESNERNLTSVIALRRFARDQELPTPPVFVRQTDGSEALDALKLMRGERTDTSRVHSFGSLEEECARGNVLRGDLDALARLIHESYCASVTAGPAAVPWEELDETFRTACRNQADHLDVKLAYARCRSLPAKDWTVNAEFSPAVVEDLTRLEHWRWWMDRMVDGWTYGAKKDVNAKTHPDMVPFDALDERVQELDRIPIRNLPRLLSAFDRVLVRQHRIGVLPGDDPNDVLRLLRNRVEAVQEEGAYAIVVLALDNDAGLELALKIATLDVAFELRLARPVSALLACFDSDVLLSLLDRAEDVDVIDEWTDDHIYATADELLNGRHPVALSAPS